MQLVALDINGIIRVHKAGCTDTTKLVKAGKLDPEDLQPFEAADQTQAVAWIWSDDLAENPTEEGWIAFAARTKFLSCGPNKLPEGDGYKAYVGTTLSASGWHALTEAETAAVHADPVAMAQIADARAAADELSAQQHQDEVQGFTGGLGQHTELTTQPAAAGEANRGSGMWVVSAWDADGQPLLIRHHGTDLRVAEISFTTEWLLNEFLGRNPTKAWTPAGERRKIAELRVSRSSNPNIAVRVINRRSKSDSNT